MILRWSTVRPEHELKAFYNGTINKNTYKSYNIIEHFLYIFAYIFPWTQFE